MKRLLYGIVCWGTLVACQREPGYKISGSVPGTPDGMKVYLYNWNTPVDSSVVKGGKFVLTGKVDVPTRYQLLIYLRIRWNRTRRIYGDQMCLWRMWI